MKRKKDIQTNQLQVHFFIILFFYDAAENKATLSLQ
jgi:hypothetical protein